MPAIETDGSFTHRNVIFRISGGSLRTAGVSTNKLPPELSNLINLGVCACSILPEYDGKITSLIVV